MMVLNGSCIVDCMASTMAEIHEILKAGLHSHDHSSDDAASRSCSCFDMASVVGIDSRTAHSRTGNASADRMGCLVALMKIDFHRYVETASTVLDIVVVAVEVH